MYSALGPTIEARKVATTPDPDPTSRQISMLDEIKRLMQDD